MDEDRLSPAVIEKMSKHPTNWINYRGNHYLIILTMEHSIQEVRIWVRQLLS
jgi:hypothetical protein